MSGRQWKAGDVAELPIGGRAWFVGESEDEPRPWRNEMGVPRWGDTANGAREPRPLVVIDPEDREQVERLTKTLANSGAFTGFAKGNSDLLHAALRSLIDPPKPNEPGVWGVVEASCMHCVVRREWIRHKDGNWYVVGSNNPDDWDSLIDPVVIRDGVTP